MWMQSEGFSWETSHLNFNSCFPGAQMLFKGLESEAKLSFNTRGSFKKPHQLPQHLHVLRAPLPSALFSLLQALCRDRKESGGALPHRRDVSPAGWQINTSSAALEEQAATAERCCNRSTACAWCFRGVSSETPREEVHKHAWQMEAVLCEPAAAC